MSICHGDCIYSLNIDLVLPHYIIILLYLLCISAAHIGRAVYQMLVIQAFRADRLLSIASHLVVAVFGEDWKLEILANSE